MIDRYSNGAPILWTMRAKWEICKNRHSMGGWWALPPHRHSSPVLMPDFRSAIAYADSATRKDRA